MCFSATVSFISGGVLSATGVVTLKKVKSKKEIPLALFPLIFGIQQFIEGLLWLSIDSITLQKITTYSFLFFALLLWPSLFPFALRIIEKDKVKKIILTVFLSVGLSISIFLLTFLLKFPVSAEIKTNIQYILNTPFPRFGTFLYIIVTCGSFLLSKEKFLKIFGIVLTASAIISIEFYRITFVSTWCFFAAILSSIIFLHFNQKKS